MTDFKNNISSTIWEILSYEDEVFCDYLITETKLYLNSLGLPYNEFGAISNFCSNLLTCTGISWERFLDLRLNRKLSLSINPVRALQLILELNKNKNFHPKAFSSSDDDLLLEIDQRKSRKGKRRPHKSKSKVDKPSNPVNQKPQSSPSYMINISHNIINSGNSKKENISAEKTKKEEQLVEENVNEELFICVYKLLTDDLQESITEALVEFG